MDLINRSLVSIIIPTKNEAGTIEEIIKQCRLYAQEILVVDGHSRDGTGEFARKSGAKVILDNKKSKGDAIKIGAKEAQGDILVFLDADGSHEISDIPRLIEPIIQNKADMVIASRMLGGSDELHGNFDQFIRNTGSSFIAVLINYRFKTNLTDVENGFRAVKKEIFKQFNVKRDDFVIEQEMVANCLKKGFRISEIASHEYKRKSGVTKLPTSQGWKFLWHFIIFLLTP